MTAGSANCFIKLLRSIPAILKNAFLPNVVRKGYQVAGFYVDKSGYAKVNGETILKQWDCYKELSRMETKRYHQFNYYWLSYNSIRAWYGKDQDVDKLPNVAQIHKEKNVQHRKQPIDQRQDEEQIVDNQQRALWLNHKATIDNWM